MPVVQIIAGHAVELYPDGVTRTIYDDQQLYEVKSHIAESMIVRGWAKVLSPSSLLELAESRQPEPPVKPPKGGKNGRPTTY